MKCFISFAAVCDPHALFHTYFPTLSQLRRKLRKKLDSLALKKEDDCGTGKLKMPLFLPAAKTGIAFPVGNPAYD